VRDSFKTPTQQRQNWKGKKKRLNRRIEKKEIKKKIE